MRRKEDFPLQKVTLNLFEGDFDWLRQNHGKLGAGKVVRELVRGHRSRIETEMAAKPLPDIHVPKEVLGG